MQMKLKKILAISLALAWNAAIAGDDAGNAENLLVFVGQIVSLTEQPPSRCDNCIVMDVHYAATYRILDTVYGNYRGSTIGFDVYDHYGAPAFSKYDTVLLFVSRQPDGSWVHEKYQFYDLYKGVDGAWYGCRDATIRGRPVEFAAPVSYPLDGLRPDWIKKSYPAEYFAIRDGRAYCLHGASVADLFETKKQTVLKARGIFK